MSDLFREHAPISAEAWREIDAEATRTLKTLLAARRLVDFNGPLGWETTCIPTGRTEKLSPPLQSLVAPVLVPLFLRARLDEKLHLHLFKFAGAK